MQKTTMLRPIAVLIFASVCSWALAQNKYWIASNGNWNDAINWSATPDGPGGAGIPRVGEDVVVAPHDAVSITIADIAWCRDLLVDATNGTITLQGTAELNISGSWRMTGSIEWQHSGNKQLVGNRSGFDLDLRGIPINGDIILNGTGSWSMLSDITIAQGDVILEKGTLVGNANTLKAARLASGKKSSQRRFIGGDGVVMLNEHPPVHLKSNSIQPGNTTLVVQGMVVPWDIPMIGAAGGDRDMNVCGTGPGQTPFIIDAQLISNYNGYGVSCRGICNGSVTVSVSGGIGPFTYQWLNSGPPSATWNAACGGPQIVIVTDIGQGISCPASVNVTEPGPLGVIFFGQGTPPTCADVCDGTRTALAVGGVSPHMYDWNNGAGNNSSFFELCAGLNSLEITDANNCTFDTTFFFNIQPVQPNLSFTSATCFGECDGTAEVAPTGGTNSFTFTWTPTPTVGQGTNSVSGLCAGNWSVTIEDSNGCDTTVAFIIDEPPAIIADLLTTNVSCFGSCDGTADLTISGTPGPFNFDWTPSPGSGQGTASASGLCEGSYTVLITDQITGCDTLISFDISAPGPFDLQAQLTDATCADACDGTIVLTPIGGTLPYSFSWSPTPPSGQGSASISGLCPGDWEVTMTDSESCDTTVVFTIGSPPLLDPGLSWTDITCAGICDGTATSVVSGGVGPYSYLWTPAPPVGQGTPDVSGLCAGVYDLLISDANGCDTLVSFEVLEPQLLEADASQDNVSCVGECDGRADVVVSGGVPGYSYIWSPEPALGQGTATAEGLCPGPLEVLITDANGCELIVNFVIEDATPISASMQILPASCPGVCDGSAEVSVSGGALGYTYIWAPEPAAGQGTPNATGLCPQEYSLTIIDALGCDTTIEFTIDAPASIMVDATVTDAICADLCNGSIALVPSGGNGTFTYVWDPIPSIGQGTAIISGLCPGEWEVLVTSGACDTTITFTIGVPPVIDVDLTITDITCPGACDGAADAIVTGGTPPFTYSWSPVPGSGQGTSTVSGLCPGGYTVLIIDAAGCDTTITFQIMEPDQLDADIQLTQASCGSACDGAATVVISGGTSPYQYEWGPGTIIGQGTDTATELCPGAYTVLVTDAAGCTETFNVLIDTPSGIEVDATLVDATCAGDCDGSITLVTSGSTGPYGYVWTPEPGVGQGTPQATGLCPGTWLVQINDALGCDTLITFEILAPDAILPNETWTDESCNGPCDGTASVAPTGGVAPYTFTWSPAPSSGQGTPAVSGLCPGQWTVLIEDASGCDTLVVFDILEQQPIDAELIVTNSLCSGECTGSASATASGGIGPYTFTWTPEPGSGQGTPDVTGLCVGSWQLLIADALGCDTTISFVIEAPAAIVPVLVVVDENCTGPCTGGASLSIQGGIGPYQILWGPEPIDGQGTTDVTGLCSGISYSVEITDANGCDTTITFSVEPFLEIVANATVTATTCADACDGGVSVVSTGGVPPYSYVWIPEPATGQGTAQATGFCAGDVEVQITDAEGCSTTAIVTITAPEPLLDNAVVTDVLCHAVCDGSIVVSPSGGVGPYDVYWSPVPQDGQGSLIASGLCMGTYQVQIVDANGCEVIFTHEIFKPDEIELTVITTPSDCQQCIGTASVSITGGIPGYVIEWTDGLGIVVGTGETVQDLCAGIHLVTVTDQNGCVATQVVPIIDPNGEVLTPVHGITSCPGTCDGIAEVAFVCSDPPCVIAWTDQFGFDLGSSATSVGSLCEGAYYASVTNASGCVSIIQVNVVEPSTLEVDISSTDVSCAGSCDGSANLDIVGGQPPFSITWDPAPGTGQGTPFASGMCAGMYAVSILDGNGCVTAIGVMINAPDPLDLDATVVNGSCGDACDGSIQPVVTGGVGPYSYAWTPTSPIDANGGIASLCSGTYELTVTDANGCTISQSYDIVPPDAIILVGNTSASTCPDCDGTASVTISGGTDPVDFSWVHQGVVVGTTQALTGLCSGIYTVTVTDANGCLDVLPIIVPDNNAEIISPIDGTVGCSSDCNGTVGVDFVCDDAPCTVQWTDAFGNVIAQNVLQVNDLCIGVYTVEVTNGSGCTTVATAVVLPFQQIIPDVQITLESCAGACDATATLDPVGGVGPYSFLWTPAPGAGQGTPVGTGLCAGAYDVLITDATGCDTTITITISEPQPITFAAVIDELSCGGDCDGSIDVTLSGGEAPYVLSWSPEPGAGQGTSTVTDLCTGTYTLTVTDANGCSQSESWTLLEPVPLELATTSTTSECGDCSGGVNVIVTGGLPPYAYSWTSGGFVFGTGQQVNGLCAGLYIVSVIDANGCQASQVVPVSDVDGPILTVDGDVTSCAGACDGTVSVDFTCIDPDCSIEWFDNNGTSIGQDVFSLDDQCAGNYFVQVTNGSGCISIDVAVVADPDPILAGLTSTSVSCAGDCDGTATITPSGGAPPYTYVWSPEPGSGQGTSAVTGLCAEVYEVIITDDLGCSVSVPVPIDEPPFLDLSSVVTPISCNGACDGVILVEPAGGTLPYSITWTPEPPNGPGVFEAVDLCAGTWEFSVTDGSGCVSNGTIQLLDPAVLEVELTSTDISCNAGCDGSAEVLITGGTAPYAITWSDDNGEVAVDVISVDLLCAGDHEVTITDASNCSVTLPFVIVSPDPLFAELEFTNESCNGPCDGTAQVTVSGGDGGPYSFVWTPEPGSGQGTSTVGGLCADLWSVTVSDGSGCDTTITFTILPFAPITADAAVTDVICANDCNGAIVLDASGGIGQLTYLWSPEPGSGQGTDSVGGLCVGGHDVTITDEAGCDATFSFTIGSPAELSVTLDDMQPASCLSVMDGSISVTVSGGVPAYDLQWEGPSNFTSTDEDLVGLAPGTYDLLVTDANGCTMGVVFEVDALSPVEADAGGDLEICPGDTIVLDGTLSIGGNTFSWTDGSGNEVAITAETTVGPFTSGIYTYTLTVSDGLCTDQDEVTIIVLEGPFAEAGSLQTIFQSGTATLGGTPTGPSGATYVWSPDSVITDAFVPNPVADPSVTQWFTVTVTGENGCHNTDSVLITVVPDIVIPTGFTPNGDGWNDTWVIDLIELFPDCVVEVYNRWGEQLFRSVGYQQPWDGRYSGGFVPVGTYYYVIDLKNAEYPDPFTGPLTVIR